MLQRVWIVTLVVQAALIAGCDEERTRVPPVVPPVVAEPDASVPFDSREGSWSREAPFVCQEGITCEQPAYCLDEQHYVEVEGTRCCGGEGCSRARCEPKLPAKECPSGTVCRHLTSAGVQEQARNLAFEFLDARELTVATCVDPRALDADGGSPSGPFVGNCGNGTQDDFELCDDGNQSSADGCTRFCTLEPGWSCSRWGEPCRPTFGELGCSANACRLGAFCVDTFERAFPPSPLGVGCECPVGALPECPPLGALGLPRPSRASGCGGSAISADGSTIVGGCSFEDTAPGASITDRAARAMRWTIAGGAEVYPGEGSSSAHDVSSDGSVIVGRSTKGPFVWTGEGVVLLGEELGTRLSATLSLTLDGRVIGAISVSADGRVVVGGENPAWVWTEAEGVRELPAATSGRLAGVIGVSPGGNRIFGYEVGPNYIGWPLLWSIDGQVQAVPVVPDLEADVVATNADASLLVINTDGASPVPNQENIPRVVLWTAEGSTTLPPDRGRALALSADGRTLIGWLRGGPSVLWRLDQDDAFELLNMDARDVSGDGRVLAGHIYHPSGDRNGRAGMMWLR